MAQKKKEVKVRDLKPSKDAKGGGGGGSRGSRNLSAGGSRQTNVAQGHTSTGKLN